MDELDLDSDLIQIEDVIAAHLAGALAGLQVSLPGVVVRADLARQRLAVRPTGGHSGVDPDTGERRFRRWQVVEEVPIAYPQAGPWGLTFPVQPGDDVLLVFSSTSLDPWHAGRDDVEPRDPRRHSIVDAVAIPGVARSRRVDASSKSALVIHGADVRVGGPDATARAARDLDLEQLASILSGAPDGLPYGSAVKDALLSSGWPNCASTVRLK